MGFRATTNWYPQFPPSPDWLFYLMREVASTPSCSPVFVYRFCSGVVKLIKHQFVSVLRARLGTTKVDQSHNFRGHSFR